MEIWLDAHLAPALAARLSEDLGPKFRAVRDLGLREASDQEIFQRARANRAVLFTKDADFADLVRRLGPPPQVVWVTVGNTRSDALRELVVPAWPMLLAALRRGEALVELTRRPVTP